MLVRFENRFDGWLPEREAATRRCQHEHCNGQQPAGRNEGRGFPRSCRPDKGDRAIGRALPPTFTAVHGRHPAFPTAGGEGGGVASRLLADGDETAARHERNTERFERVLHPLAGVAGQPAHLEAFDGEIGV